ncbi:MULTISPECIES: ABC transporter permease [Microbacterium]|uniref:ABC transporter permease n=1 Tax=Microbacterium marmarense TaxID=3122051 RepID=A0ABU8LUP5_9MICO
MNLFIDAFAWLFDPANWQPGSQSPLPLQDRIAEHLLYTFLAVAIAALIALPAGFYIGHTGRGRQFVISFTGAMRALPTLGVLFFLTMVLGSMVRGTAGVFWGTMIALVILAIPSILAGAYAGLESVSRQTIDAARANGMTEMQILTRVEIPLALPLIIGGLRSGVLQVIATAVIASYAGLGGIGRVISSGIGLNDYDRILGGAILVTVVALVIDGAFAIVQRLTRVPGAGNHAVRAKETKLRRRATRSSAAVETPIREGNVTA